MSDDMIEIRDDQIDVRDIMRQIRANLARRAGETAIDPVAIREELWAETIGSAAEFQEGFEQVPLTRHDCDIVPRNYVINWRNPVLGPPNALIRRVINTEIRRYLDASLAKQTRFNETAVRVLRQLSQENAALRRELKARSIIPPHTTDVT